MKGYNTDVAATIDAYIGGFPGDVQARLEAVRAAIRKAAPGATEGISYRIAAFKLDGKPLLYFAGFKNHIGLYPMTAGVKAAFAKQLAGFPQSTGTVRFPHDGALPTALIETIAKFRAQEIRDAAAKPAKAAKTAIKPARATKPKTTKARP